MDVAEAVDVTAPVQPVGEAELLRRCRAGVHDAWRELLSPYQQSLINFIHRIDFYGTEEDAQDRAQEIFIEVVRSLKSFEQRSSFRTWLFSIARNIVSAHRKKVKAGKRGGGARPISLDEAADSSGESSGTLADRLEDSRSGTPRDRLYKKEDFKALVDAMEALGEDCRKIIELSYFAEFSYEEIARELGEKLKTVSSRLSKCKGKLGTIYAKITGATCGSRPQAE